MQIANKHCWLHAREVGWHAANPVCHQLLHGVHTYSFREKQRGDEQQVAFSWQGQGMGTTQITSYLGLSLTLLEEDRARLVLSECQATDPCGECVQPSLYSLSEALLGQIQF